MGSIHSLGVVALLGFTSVLHGKATGRTSYDLGTVNNGTLSESVGPESRGDATLRAQILLDRANFSSGQIDGRYGKNLGSAIRAFQRSRQLPENGAIGPETWRILNQDTDPALHPYTIAAEDVAGPFTKIPRRMAAKAKLPSSSFQSSLELLAEKFHCAPALLRDLNPDQRFDTAGATLLVPNVAHRALALAASVVVSENESGVSVLDAEGKLIAWFPASVGSSHDPLPVGSWKILGVRRDPIFHYNPRLFWDADSTDTRSTIPPGPNNPVGVVWIALSKPHYGLHGTPEPAHIGYTESHGCIRLTNWDALKLASAVKPGTRAILQE